MNRLFTTIALLLLIVFTCSCKTTLTVRGEPGANLGKDLTYYVAQQPDDTHAINVTICDQLNGLGRKTTTGPMEQFPENADVLVKYVDRWYWDITMYLLSLDISFRDAMTEEEIAGGFSLKTSLIRKDKEWHTRTILSAILAKIYPGEYPSVD